MEVMPPGATIRRYPAHHPAHRPATETTMRSRSTSSIEIRTICLKIRRKLCGLAFYASGLRSNPQSTEFINQFSVPLERTYGWRINLLTSLTCEFALSQILNTICRDKAGITTLRI
jgi:hypothetical protein